MGLRDLFRPKWQHSDYRVRRLCLQTLSEESIILEMAKDDASPDLRTVALKKLSEQRSLLEVGLQCAFPETRKAATALLRDQGMLRDLVTTSEHPEVRQLAVARLSDPGLLAEVARLTDSSRLKEATAAVARIGDQEVLARGADHPSVRATAVSKLSDQALLRTILAADPNENVRKAAVLRVADVGLVETIARSGRSVPERCAAIGRLDDRALLEDLVTDPDDDIQNAACRRLEKVYAAARKQGTMPAPESAWESILNSPDHAGRKAALLQLIERHEATEVLQLTGLAVLSDDPEVRQIALDGIVQRGNAGSAIGLIRSWRDGGSLLNLAGPMNAEHRMRAGEIEGDFLLRGFV